VKLCVSTKGVHSFSREKHLYEGFPHLCALFVVMNQEYEKYLPSDHATWQTLFSRQVVNLQDKACSQYLQCLADLAPELVDGHIPRFEDLDRRLAKATGWEIEVVPGLIPVADFFDLMARRRFCSSTWIRKPHQLDYLEEPDMFHDIFGHVPLLMDPTYASFMHRFGLIGQRFAGNEEAETQLERLYWFTIEFGLLYEAFKPTIFGAGILSSYGESKQIFESDIRILPFDIDAILGHAFRKDVMQTEYYALRSVEELAESLDRVEGVLDRGYL
jgi:phenylalanine-4-hydroxylase